MKKNRLSVLSVVLMFSILSSCQSKGPGPTAWIDQPLNKSEFSNAPITIQAHASDEDGVTVIAFFVMGEKIGEKTTGGKRLENASVIWEPQATGEYQLSVQGTDSMGNLGDMTSVGIIITDVSAETISNPTAVPLLGELCTEDELEAPVLLSPQNGATIEGEPQFSWSYPDITCHPLSYTIDISLDSSFQDISLGFGTADHNETSRLWPLSAGKCYFWQVRAIIPGVDGPKSPAWTFCISPTPEVAVELPSITVDQDTNCRNGPGTGYEAVDFSPKGSTLEIMGRNNENTWYWVKPTSGANNCWISGSIGAISGDPLKAPVIEVANLPIQKATDTPTPAAPPGLIITSVVDTTPPQISSVEFIPPVIAASAPVLCPGYVDVDIIVYASDNSGSVEVYAELPSTGLVTKLLQVGSHYAQAVSPGSIPGTIPVIIHAYDAAGNHVAADGYSFTVIPCLQ